MNFANIIGKAATHPDQAVRDESEKILFEAMARDYQNFLLECMTLYIKRDTDLSLRLASVQIIIASMREQDVFLPQLGLGPFFLGEYQRQVCSRHEG